jgi:hypothetical protein
MTTLAITPTTLHNEDKFIEAIEKLEQLAGKQVKEVVLKNMVLTVKEWKE